MAMGQNGMVNITPEMMRNALSAIDDYEAKSNTLRTGLADTVRGLIPSSFSGSAAEGFSYFHEHVIDLIAGENLTNLLKSLREMFEGTLKAIPDTGGLDDQLGDGNRQ